MLFRLCIGYIFVHFVHFCLGAPRPAKKRKSTALIQFSCFLSSFSIVNVLEHLDVTVHTSARGPTPTCSSFPHPRLFPPYPHPEVTFLEKWESYQHAPMLPGQFAICLCSQRWVIPAFFFMGWSESRRQSWHLQPSPLHP